ncbi:MAG TPA: butyrate kinase [Candidatus Ozemobacteraceae bacterium]|nr:butyrate kinase [Candidatus Ozemobacteraceae bacterium]
MKQPLLLVINPGSTSTKVALFDGTQSRAEQEITHPGSELSKFSSNLEQLDFRLGEVRRALETWKIQPRDLQAVIGRGGPLKPMEGGVYRLGDALLNDLRSGKLVDHASILGGLLAYRIAGEAGIPAFIADPVSVDEFDDLARISGHPDLPRISLAHALNCKAVIREVARDQKRNPEDLNLIVAHLGGGISIVAHRQGRQIDVNNANDSGPFSPERAGTLPLTGLLKLACSGKHTLPELRKMLIGKGGLIAHLGTADVREVQKRIDSGDQKARLVLEAMAYTIAKEIGAMATVLKGKVDTIILTGGVAYSKTVTDWITERVQFIAPVVIKPGQNELKALAEHAVTALQNPSMVKDYR